MFDRPARIALLCLSLLPTMADAAEPDSPVEVVKQWLAFHREDNPKGAVGLTTGSHYIHSPKNFAKTKQSVRCLGNQHSAAVITNPAEPSQEDPPVLICWLVRPNSSWKIHKSQTLKLSVVNQQLRGYLEAGNVHWNIPPSDLHGAWSTGPCHPPWATGVVCGNQIDFEKDTCRLTDWGPAGPPPEEFRNAKPHSRWRLWNGNIVFTRPAENDKFVVRIAWWEENRLELELLNDDGYGAASIEYDRDEF